MNVKIAGHDRPVRAPGALPSPIGLLPASENAKWVGMLVSFALGLILSTAHIAGSPAPFGLAFLAAMGYGSGGALCLAGCALGYFAAFGVATGTQLAAGCCLIFSDGIFSAQSSVCADALVSVGRLRGGLHTDAAGAVPAHGRPVAAAGVSYGTVFAAVRRIGLWI